MKTLLSTKKLTASQRELILGAGLSLVSYDAIRIVPLEFDMPDSTQNVIFTSQNAVRTVLAKIDTLASFGAIFCVGKKTKALCEEFSGNVVFWAENSQLLADYLKKHSIEGPYTYFCSSQRLDILPKELKSAKIQIFELKTYKIAQNLHQFGQKWNGILFFSPSGVRSFFAANPSPHTGTLFCIGLTTASEAKKFSKKVVISNNPTTESLIAKAVKTLKQ